MICSRCGENKDESHFYWRNETKGIRHKVCIACKSKLAAERWSTGNIKESNYASKLRRVQRAQDYIWSVLIDSECADCGEQNPVVLEFDHIGTDKFLGVSQMVSSNYGVEKIKQEIAKCQVVCANCHRIRTSVRGNHWRGKRLT